MVKAIILSGGWGTRLRPLTCTTPKTLIPVVNKPVIERQILLLKKAGVKEIILAVSVMADELKRYFKSGERLGVQINYTNEKHPMGTAGAIKLAESYLSDDNFFMLNGDIIINFDLKEMLMKHGNYGGKGTIASRIVDDPSRYGVLILEQNTNQILKFLEKSEYKPPEGRILPIPVNAGVYILEPDIFSYIKLHKKVSIELDVFPKLASEKLIYNYPISGIWKDIGKPEELLEGNILLMNDILKKLDNNIVNLIDDSARLEGKTTIYPPVTIGENVVIKNNCTIGPNVIIGDNVFIDRDTKIKDSVIYGETYIAKNVYIEYAIISDNCHIRNNAILKGNNNGLIILGSVVEVTENKKLLTDTDFSISICHHESVKEDKILSN